MFRRIGIVFLTALLLAACAPHGVDEARRVVAEADSLWQAGLQYGIDEGDSATLAQAYKTLEAIPLPFREGLGLGSPYAHACYHYGRLLRRADDPVAAMQVFISGTHSGTDDHHILGRIYSNMGDLCHFASEFQLSYDMYERSAHYFLENGDTLLYYYGLNNMAYELAEQGKKAEAYSMLSSIDSCFIDPYFHSKMLETRSNACKQVQQYDSAAYYAILSYNSGYHEPTILLFRAQAYSFMGLKDSAVFYAKQVMKLSNSTHNQNNALYILTQDDESTDKETALKISAESLQRANVLKINDEELDVVATMLLGEPTVPGKLIAEDPEKTRCICRELIARYELDMLILTCGAIGSYVFTASKESYVATPKVQVADTVGAGDSFTATFVAQLLLGKTIREAHEKAVAVSAYVCTQRGAMPLLPAELKA